MKPKAKTDSLPQPMKIPALHRKVVEVTVRGNAPLVQHRFGAKARTQIREKQEKGDEENKSTKRKLPPRNFDAEFKDAMYQSSAGWYGIPCGAIRNSLVSALGMMGKFKTDGKRGIFILPDGYAKPEKGEAVGVALVKITKGKPERHETAVRLADMNRTATIRVRPMFREGWEAKLRIEFDEMMIKDAESVVNLVQRAGFSIGWQEGRPDSPKGCGMGWGTFDVKGKVVKG